MYFSVRSNVRTAAMARAVGSSAAVDGVPATRQTDAAAVRPVGEDRYATSGPANDQSCTVRSARLFAAVTQITQRREF